MVLSVICALAAFSLPLLAAAAPPVLEERATNPTVTIASGVVVGTATGVLNQPTVTGLANAYLGVPFAQSPPLRFAPPTAPDAWSSPLIAQNLPPACFQEFGTGPTAELTKKYINNPGYPPPAESEDCLYLNIFAPQSASPTNVKPVLFWIYGGNLSGGTASLAYYNGSSLAVNEDVVVVAINYRTNIFGYSNSPEIPFGQQNSGFLDQRFALEWVQTNIQQFGGDPSQVTIFGESAGGYSVKQLLANPPSPLTFRAAIMESQQFGPFGNGLSNYNDVLKHFGCDTASSPLACIRLVPGIDIQTYINDQGLYFPPVDNDGTSVGHNSLPSIVSGKFAAVPIFIGTNKDEFRIFEAILGLDDGTDLVDGVYALTGINISSIEPAILAAYDAEISNDAYVLIGQVATDLVFTCTTQSLSSAIATAGRQPVWRYRFDAAAFPDIAYFPNPGAYHSSEIPEVWGTYPLSNAYGDATPTQIALSAYMQGVWAGFAKDPGAGVPWPKLGSNFGVELGLLGGDGNPEGEQTVALATADYPCAIYDPLLLALNFAY